MITLAGILEGVQTRKDKTLKLTFGSQELPPNEAGKIMAMANSFCFVSFKPESFTETEKEMMAQIKADMLTNNAKTPSQRLRSVIYILFTHNNEGFNNFDSFYTHKMEQIISHLKTKLP